MEPGAVSYHKESLLGCKHYQRNCKIKAACCGKLFVCRLCHDEAINQHSIDRFATKEVECMKCFTIQPVSKECIQCKSEFAKYFCGVCKFYDNSAVKKIYHCDLCGICRIGDKEEYKHCIRCKGCLFKETFDSHVCIEAKYSDSCPICLEDMFSSRDPISTLKCGHPIHTSCQQDYLKSGNFTCPTCKKSIVDLDWTRLEREIQRNKMPAKYAKSTCSIICNDCCTTTNDIPYHFIGHKCSKQDCNSYNTTITNKNLIIDENAPDDDINLLQQNNNNNNNNEEESDEEDYMDEDSDSSYTSNEIENNENTNNDENQNNVDREE